MPIINHDYYFSASSPKDRALSLVECCSVKSYKRLMFVYWVVVHFTGLGHPNWFLLV